MVLIARQRLPAARQLIADLTRSKFGFLDVPVEDSNDSAQWRKTIDFAKRHGLVPENLRLVKQHGHCSLRISLVAGAHANTKNAQAVPPVPLPSRLVAIHPSVAAIRDADDKLQMPAPMRQRALLVLQALAAEFQRRGWTVTADAAPLRDYYYGRLLRERQGRIKTDVGGVSCWVSILQNSPQATDPEKLSALAIEISPAPMNAQRRWVDRKRLRLEDRLADIVGAVKVAAAESAERNVRIKLETDQRQARWEFAMARAKSLAIEDRHLRELRRHVDRWKFANDLRAYVREMEVVLADCAGDDAERAGEWIDWARAFLDGYDLTRGFPPLPDIDKEPTPKELEAHLDGLSPYGP
jgi:hypothetical protein